MPERRDNYTEEVHEILGAPPAWIVRWGMTVILMVIAVILAGTWFYKYPDLILSRITILSENPPVRIVARATGKLDEMYVKNNQIVSAGEVLGNIENSAKIVAVAGVHPYLKLLYEDVDVIIGGRSGDIAFIASPAIKAGFPEALAYHMGKIIECASFCAEPFGGKETVIGTISHEDIKITPYNPPQRCTIASISGHSMYERANPYFEYAAGGMLDLRECKYEQFDERTTRVTGAKWVPTEKVHVKIEGARYVGERYMGISAIRDPFLVEHIDDVVRYCKDSTEKLFGKEGYQIFFHVFGKNGVLKEMEPVKKSLAHEMCIVIEVVSLDDYLAAKITDYALRMTFLARVPGVKGTAGAAATTKLPMKANPGYVWSINHTVTVDDPMELFKTYTTYAGV